MTELSPKGNLFDKSFEVRGRYVAQLKSGLKLCYTKRSEIWKDKTACYWITLELWHDENEAILSNALEDQDIIFCGTSVGSACDQFDVRYNEISAIWEV